MTPQEEYFKQVRAWEHLYGVPKHGLMRFDPAEVRVACFRCKRIKTRMSRHHTGNDYLFACMMPEVFAARYIRFEKEDVERLCDSCHKEAHKAYKDIAYKMWAELQKNGARIVTEEWCRKWMGEFRAAFYEWCSVAKRRKRRKKHGRRIRKG